MGWELILAKSLPALKESARPSASSCRAMSPFASVGQCGVLVTTDDPEDIINDIR